ncbi:MAG: transketolase [Sphaerochaetaceae bacterium]|nr:transketolase [Sphaerochaetaceae bacterium]
MNKNEIEMLKNKAKEVRETILTMIYKAQSGHPGGSLSIADIMTVLYFRELRIDPENPHWNDRDRFVLSKGHACPAWYSCLYHRGFFDEKHISTFRRVNSILQGHPDMKKTPGVDMTTGSLGMGVATAVGMALDARLEGSSRRVYAIVGDGELNEGVVWEVMQSSCKFKLDNFCMIIDRNGLQLDGTTEEVMPFKDLSNTIESFGWFVQTIDGHSVEEIDKALQAARETKGGPSCIIADTIKGKGVSFMENQLKWHGRAPSDEEYELAVKEIRGEEN